uniref:Uncharacterized protein n=1 Tax=Rhizophora mucronata TaxID=61149 RepID=A0A2P2Q0H3_RHIMU
MSHIMQCTHVLNAVYCLYVNQGYFNCTDVKAR